VLERRVYGGKAVDHPRPGRGEQPLHNQYVFAALLDQASNDLSDRARRKTFEAVVDVAEARFDNRKARSRNSSAARRASSLIS